MIREWSRRSGLPAPNEGTCVGWLLVEVPMPSVSDVHWIDADTVLVGPNTGIWATVPLRTQDLIASARDGVTRGFSNAECNTYRIDPCPTLDEIRSEPDWANVGGAVACLFDGPSPTATPLMICWGPDGRKACSASPSPAKGRDRS
jgi:hypothetical protein